jgi:hypothetical protein
LFYRHLLNVFLLVCITMSCHAQSATLRFVPFFQGEELKLNKYYHLTNGDSISFSTFKCYVSDIIVYGWGKTVFPKKNLLLLNAEEPSSMTLKVKKLKDIAGIKLSIGVDSLKSVSGAMGGNLDPEKGMYWAWQSGYINFKIEGQCNKVPARNNEFQYHVGGYAGKDKAVQEIILSTPRSNEILVLIRLDKFLARMDMTKQHSIMIPGTEAVDMAKQFARCFEINAR